MRDDDKRNWRRSQSLVAVVKIRGSDRRQAEGSPMNGVAVCRKLVAMVVVALSGSGILVATSAPSGAAAAGGCPGTAYVTNYVDGTVSVITTATGAVSAPITVG